MISRSSSSSSFLIPPRAKLGERSCSFANNSAPSYIDSSSTPHSRSRLPRQESTVLSASGIIMLIVLFRDFVAFRRRRSLGWRDPCCYTLTHLATRIRTEARIVPPTIQAWFKRGKKESRCPSLREKKKGSKQRYLVSLLWILRKEESQKDRMRNELNQRWKWALKKKG